MVFFIAIVLVLACALVPILTRAGARRERGPVGGNDGAESSYMTHTMQHGSGDSADCGHHGSDSGGDCGGGGDGGGSH